MPITITTPYAGNVLGPGVVVQLASDFVGPLPTGSYWSIQVLSPPSEQTVFLWQPLATSTNFLGHFFDPKTEVKASFQGLATPKQGDTVTIDATLVQAPSTVIDSGQKTGVPWDNTVGEPFTWQNPVGVQGGTGLSPEEAQQLQETHDSTFPSLLPLQVAPVLVPSPGPGAPINVTLPQPVFGIIVRMTKLPDGLAPQTPDGQYWVPSLAVVRIFRDNDLWMRVPIHTPTKIVGLWNEQLVTAVSALFTVGWPPSIRLLVDFLPGAEGNVLLMNFP